MTALDDGRDRWRAASEDIRVVNLLDVIEKNTFAKWMTSLGNEPGFIATSLATLPDPEDVGFRATFKNGVAVSIWAIDLRNL